MRDKYTQIISGLAAAILIAGLAAVPLHAEEPAGCDAKALNGAYGYRMAGFAYDSYGNMYMMAAARRMVSDGEKGLTGSHTYSFDGNIVKQTYTGSYEVSEDCTGRMTLAVPNGSEFHFDIVIVNNGIEVQLVQTDTGYSLTGDMKQQKPVSKPPAAPAEPAPTEPSASVRK